jgi:hypothetical protein
MERQRRDEIVCNLVRAEQLTDRVGELRKEVDNALAQGRAMFRGLYALRHPSPEHQLEAERHLDAMLNATVEPLYRKLDCYEAELNGYLVTLSDLLIDDNARSTE